MTVDKIIPLKFNNNAKIRYGIGLKICTLYHDDHVGRSILVMFGVDGEKGFHPLPNIEVDCGEIQSVVKALRDAADKFENDFAAAQTKDAVPPAPKEPYGPPAPPAPAP